MNMILHKKFGIAFPAKHFKITWKFIFWQIDYYCVMFFENFRSNCLQEYNIDPCYYFSAPHFTFDAFLKHSSRELFWDPDYTIAGFGHQMSVLLWLLN